MVETQPAADLTITFSRQAENQYWAELRYNQPDGQVEQAPVRAPVQIDLGVLRKASLNSQQYGQALSEALFRSQALRDFFLQSLPAAGAGQRDLRLRVSIDRSALELHDLRWETLLDPNQQQALSLSPTMPFSRFLYSNDWRTVELRQKGSLRALVVVANPTSLKQGVTLLGQPLAEVDVAGEVQRARDGLNGIPTIDVLESQEANPGRVVLPALQTALFKGYDILYLVCHGVLLPLDPDDEHSPIQPFVILEQADGAYARVNGNDIVQAVRGLPVSRRPRLVVLASCQSGGQGKVPAAALDPGEQNNDERSYDRGALSALGPLLVAEGIPAVVAMQANVKMETVKTFIPAFFTELLRHGRVDLAMSVARSQTALANHDDWWAPVLYLRLRGGKLWYEPGFASGANADFLWPGILKSVERNVAIPILGAGLLETMIGPLDEIATRWAAENGYPLAAYNQQDLTQVSQYLAARAGWAGPRDALEEDLKIALRKVCSDLGQPAKSQTLLELMREAGQLTRANDERDPYRILAGLPYTIYVCTTPDNLIEDALREQGRDPQVLYYCWRSSLRTPDLVKRLKNLKEPTVQQPLVYYLFGYLADRRSWVLSEDDYFEYLMWINKPDNAIPEILKNAWTHNPLLFLGFRLRDWSFRVLFRSILNEDRRKEIGLLGSEPEYYSVAVQLQPGDDNLRPEGARSYLGKFFPSQMFNLYWGSAENFLSELQEQWLSKKQQEGGV